MHAMTAAHRTLPLGSIVRVTNLKTGHTALVRITDRGPFIPGRVLDLSLAAARKLDVYQPGVAEVRVEVMQTPAPIQMSESGWCRLAASLTKAKLQALPTTSCAAITRRKCSASAVPREIGGCGCECSTTIASAHSNSRRKPKRPWAWYFWSDWISAVVSGQWSVVSKPEGYY